MTQAKAERIEMNQSAFEKINNTKVYWLGGGGAMINSRGTVILIDPLLQDFDMPVLTEAPFGVKDAGHIDAVLITHCDNDHFSKSTLLDLKDQIDEIHTTHYVAQLSEEIGLEAKGHDIHDSFTVNGIKIPPTPADHAWQNVSPKHSKVRHYEMEDFCGFRIETEDGVIWMPGDSRLMQEQLEQDPMDLILMDISDSRWHIGLDGVEKMAAAYPETPLLPIHWGCVDAPEWKEFNGDPAVVKERIVNPERLYVKAVGEAFELGAKD